MEIEKLAVERFSKRAAERHRKTVILLVKDGPDDSDWNTRIFEIKHTQDRRIMNNGGYLAMEERVGGFIQSGKSELIDALFFQIM